jgi:putative ABC transport system ATP-binding protein
MSVPVIETRDVVKDYTLGHEHIRVLPGVNLVVPSGAYVAIMGHSGSGKSTLLHILGCLDRPTSGEYLFNGQSVAHMKEGRLAEVRNREIGFVFQNFNLLSKLDIAANVELPLIYANVHAKERKKRVNEMLERFGLAHRSKHKPNEISGGQKQRVAIARALVKKPALILADEPTGNLDSTTSDEILAVFDELHAEGNTIVIITHEHDVAARAKKCIRLVDGRIVE